jgi:hypothetical protein
MSDLESVIGSRADIGRCMRRGGDRETSSATVCRYRLLARRSSDAVFHFGFLNQRGPGKATLDERANKKAAERALRPPGEKD